MGTIPYALSVHSIVNSVGADAGFASIIGLAILVLLYFAQARETATLRDHLADADQRMAHLEQRLSDVQRSQAPATGAGGAVAAAGASGPGQPRPAVAAAMGAGLASGRRVGLLDPIEAGMRLPGAPAGVGAPALAAATKLIPTLPPAAASRKAPSPLLPSPLPVGAGPSTGPEDTLFVAPGGPPPATAAGANGHSAPVVPRPAPVTTRPTFPASGGGGGVRTGRSPASARGGAGVPLSGGNAGNRGGGRRLVPALIALVAAVVIVVALLIITGGNGTKSTIVHHPVRTVAHSRGNAGATPVTPASVSVAVLNGTAVTNLAHDIALKLDSAGYKTPTAMIETATDQTHATTIVGYLPGYQRDAEAVAKSLGLGPSSVQAADTQATGVACASAGAASSSSCAANVIVTVGADLASAASGTPTTTT
jgi:hypothetical protein